MADTQLNFCRFRWNNYQSRITKAFEDLFYDEVFTDVTLACEGKSLKAHRVILSACSSYFTELFKSTPCKHPVIVFQNVAFRDLHALVRFIYHGEVSVHQSSLSSFLKTAETLGISGFTQQVDKTDNNEDVQFTNSNSDELLDHTSGFGNGLQTSDLADTSQKQEVGGFGSLQPAIEIDYQRQIQQQIDQTDRDEHVQFTGSNNDESLDRTSGFGNGLQTSDLAETSQKQKVGSLQSAIKIDYQRQIQQSPMNESDRCSEMIVQTQQELQRIEGNLIDDISQMEFVKSEPSSPRLDPLADEHESCLSSNHIIKEVHTNLDSAHYQDCDCSRYNPRYNQLLQPKPRKSLNDDLELRWLQLSNVTSLIVVHKEQDQSLSTTYCKLCQKNYSTVPHLRRHFAYCHLYKPKALICDQCGKSFKSKHSLYCHKRSYHVHNRRGKYKNKY